MTDFDTPQLATRMPTRRQMLRLGTAYCGAAMTAMGVGMTNVYAQGTFPTRQVRIVVPFGPSTGPDVLGRTLAQQFSERWGPGAFVENRSGATTLIGTRFVMGSPPDGHTLMVTANTLVLNKALRPQVAYDPTKDLQPIIQLGVSRLTLVAHPALGITSLKELVSRAKQSPGSIDYASPANGTPHHLTMELLKLSLGIDLNHIPYTSTPQAVSDLLGGTVKLMFLPVHLARPQVQTGKLVMLASGGRTRAETTPDVPSLAEASGLKDIDIDGDVWYGMFAPAGTPPEIVMKLNSEVNAILQSTEIKTSLADQGITPVGGRPEALATLVRNDLAKWTKVVKAAGLKAD